MADARVVIFSYDEVCRTAADTIGVAGSVVSALVIPSNRTGPGLDDVRSVGADLGVPVVEQPPRREIGTFTRVLEDLNPDIAVIWSYPMILPAEVIEIPNLACVNVHGGLLPEYRGGHVMNWAIINGETETGATLHHVDSGIDTGPVIGAERFPIERRDDALSVRRKLVAAGTRVVRNWWPALLDGTAPRQSQDESVARYFPMRKPDDGVVKWNERSERIYDLVRALVRPWPGAFTFHRGRKLAIWKTAPEAPSQTAGVESSRPADGASPQPGSIVEVTPQHIRVQTGCGSILILEAEWEGSERPRARGSLDRLGLVPGDLLEGTDP